MNSANLIRLVLIGLVCATAIMVFRITKAPTPLQTSPSATEPLKPTTQPAIADKPVVGEAAARAEAEPAPEPSAIEPQPVAESGAPPLDPKALNAESLKGTRWKDNQIEVAFLPDGRWEMNGRICAKWVVEGNRVKIFDDKGEVHYVDIVGDTLEFNGQKIGRMGG